MTILHLLGTSEFAGTEQMVLTICDGQRERGHRVCVAIRERGGIEPYLRRMQIDIIEPRIGPLTAPIAVANACREYGVDILHSHLTSGTHTANAVSVLTGIPVVGHLHVYSRDIGHKIAAKRGALIAVSEHTRSYYTEKIGIRKDRIVTITNGSSVLKDPDAKLSRGTAAKIVAEELGLDPGTNFVTLAGRVTHQKGQDVFVEAAARVLERLPEIHFLLVGSPEDREFAQQIKNRIFELGLNGRIHMLGFRRDVAKIVRGSTVAVVPSRYDPCPLATLEAMLLGTPLIGSEVGGIAENLARPEHGILFPSEDAGALANAILTYLSNPEAAQRTAEAAQQEAIAKFSVDAMLDRVDQVYRQVLGPKASADAVTAGSSQA